MDLLYHYQPTAGYTELAGPAQGLRWIRFGVLRLRRGESVRDATGGCELALVVLGGRCRIEVGDQVWPLVGGRRDVFSGPAHSVYVPRGHQYAVTGVDDLVEVAVCAVAARRGGEPRLIAPEAVRYESRGARHWRRDIYDIITPEFPADRIIIVEVRSPPGHWSSFPPHRHEVDELPREVAQEEIYYYRTQPAAGFGVQAIYTDDRSIDQACIVRDHDVFLIPRGYHPVATAPTTNLYYLCVLAGDQRAMCPRDDPDHAWFRSVEALAREEPR